MDRFADVMIARGATLTPDRTIHTGSMRILDLPDAGAAWAFAFEEPYHRRVRRGARPPMGQRARSHHVVVGRRSD
jgi:hypothetical protein